MTTPPLKGDLVVFRTPGVPWEQWKRIGVGHVISVGTGSYTVATTNTGSVGTPAPKKGRKPMCPFVVGNFYTVPRGDCYSVLRHPER